MKTFLARWFRRKSQTTRCLRGHCMSLEGLESRIPLTANILVTTEVGGEQVMQEYDPSGTLIDAIVIPPGGVAEQTRDLVADTNGDVHVYNGTNSPHLSTYNSDTDTWTHQTMSGWSTFSSSYYGGIGVSGDYVFATDMWGGGSAAPNGIVRFDLDDGSSTRFDNRYSYTDLTVGLDGLLYAHYSRTVRVYDPDTLSLQRTINLPFSINGQSQVYRGIAVDASGDIFAASWMEMVHHFDSNGVVQNSTTISGPGSGMFGNLTDIDVSADGRLALGSYWGHVVQMNTDFTDVSYFSTGNKSTFVAFAADGQPMLPSISVGDQTVSEGDVGSTFAQFQVSLSSPSDTAVSVDYQTAGDSATSGTDFVPTSGTLTFAPGETIKTIAVEIIGDIQDEDDETFQLLLTNPSGAVVGDGQGAATIVDDDTLVLPSLSINNLFVDEGSTGSVNAVFDVTLSAASSQPVSVNYATTNGTALAGSDYTTTSGSLTFAAGETTKLITVPIVPDQVDEFTESLYVDLSSPSGATISNGRGIATILDDDTASFSISDATVVEGDSGTTPANFMVSLSTPSSFTVRIDYATADGPAIAGMDYAATSGTLTFAPGETSKVIAVDVFGDTVDEDNRSFVVNLSNPFFAALGDSQGVGTIEDDDDAAIPSLNIDSVSIDEGDPGDEVYVEFYVSLSAASSQDVSVDFATVDGSALAGSDYNTYDGRLTFSGGSTTQRIVVPIISDLVDEPSSEEFYVDLSSPFGAVIGVGRGTVTINDDDTASLSIADATVQEGDSGTTDANFLVSLSTPSASTVQVDYDTVNGTAVAGTDYTAASGTLTFAPGETSKAVSVPVVGDAEVEPNEDFSVVLSSASFASILDGTASGTIQNDDYDIGISIDDVFKMERFPDEFDFTVSLSAPSSQTVTVDYSNTTTLGFAEPGVDYVAESGTITFAPGETSKTLSITVIDDTIDELTEEFFVDLFSPSGAFLADSQGEGFIPDDDTAVLSVADVTLVEGDSGSTTATFDVNFSTSIYRTVTVDYATSDWTATAGSDYSAVAGVLTFEPGETSQSVTVQVYGDDLHERDELIYFEVSSTFNDAYREDVALGIIDDDDMPSFSVSDASVVEGDTGTVQLVFTVSLSNPSEVLTGVQYVTAGGTATAGVDYQSASGTLAFDPFETSKTVAVDIFGDLDAELDETLNLILTQHSGGLMEDNIGEGIIVDND